MIFYSSYRKIFLFSYQAVWKQSLALYKRIRNCCIKLVLNQSNFLEGVGEGWV